MSYDPKRKIGPNMKRFVIYRMSAEAIPPGGGFADGAKFLSSKESIMNGFYKSAEWCCAAVDAVRSAMEPNPWKTADDEAIAGELLRQIDERKAERP